MIQRSISQKVAVAVVYVAAMFMAIMDTTIVNVALPTITRDLHATTAEVATTVIAFLVSLAVFIPASSWLGDRFGAKRVLLGSIIIFTGASALCGAATTIAELDAFRILQGVGGGLMTPVGLAMLFRVFPPEERVRASSILVVPTALAPALGPVLGGLFVTDASWRLVFYVNVPIGIAAFVFGILFVDEQRPDDVGRFDLPGFVLAGAGLGLTMYGVSDGPDVGWSHAKVISSVAVGLVLLAVLVVVELRRSAPMLDLRLYSDRLFRSTSGVLTLGSIAFLGTLYLVALFFQEGLGLSALAAGLSIFPEAIGVMLGAQLVTRLAYPTLGPRRVMASGLTVVAAATVLLAQVGHGTDLWLVRLVLFVLGAGMSAVMVPSTAAAFATVGRARTGNASTLFNAQRQLGGAVGVALLTTVLTLAHPFRMVGGHLVAHISAYHDGFYASAVIAVLGVVCALTVIDTDAASTIVPRHRRNGAPSSDGPSSAAPGGDNGTGGRAVPATPTTPVSS